MKLLPKFKLALFDLDGTLTKEKSAWEYIHRRLGVWDGYAEKFQESFVRGEISYEEFCRRDAAIWKGMNVSEFKRILHEIPFHSGAEEVLIYLKEKGVKLGMISSGLSFLADRVKNRFGFDYAVANDLVTKDGVLTGDIKIQVHYDQKAEWVDEARRKFQVKKEEILAVGDSTGDIPMFRNCGFSIAFNCVSPRLESIANLCVRSNDLREIIPVLIPYLGPPEACARLKIAPGLPEANSQTRNPSDKKWRFR
jgi:phosphoserine phosphatase